MTTSTPMAAGERLPRVDVRDRSGRPVRWRRAPGGASLVVFPHPDCEPCRRYLDRLRAHVDRLGVWDARPIVVDAEDVEEPPGVAVPDPDGRIRSACGVDAAAAAVVIADRWGAVYRSTTVGPGHDFPTVDDLLEWATYMVTQCPECGVLDEPGAEIWSI